MYSYAYYELGDHHDAEDATERTFLLALTHLGRFEERAQPSDGEGASTFRVWLFRIARNVVANQRRAHRRRPEAPLEAAAVVHDPLDVERDATARAEAATAWAAVGRLPGDRRRAVVLRFVDEMSTAEIAGVLGKTEGAVRVLIHRALRSVARDLGRARAMSLPPSERAEADALLTDLYLDALLAARERHATDAPTAADLDPAVRAVAARLAADLGRVHPSFRFEERLAARLAEAAARLRLAMAAGAEAASAPTRAGDPAGAPGDPADEIGAWPVDADPARRPTAAAAAGRCSSAGP